MYVIYLKDYENHKKLLAVVSEKPCAAMLCNVLNKRCSENLSEMDKDEIIFFAEINSLDIDKSMINEVHSFGSYFAYQKVNKHHSFDFSVFEADWDSTLFDSCTSDAHDYYNTQEWLDWHDDFVFDYDYGVTDFVDTKHINSHKLKKFACETNQYKKFDPEFAHQDVVYKFGYRDPLSTFAHHHGFRIGYNHIQRIINSIKVCESVKNVVDKIKENIKYKKNHPFKTYADWVINALQSNDVEKHKFYFNDFEIVDGTLWRKSKMLRYLGYGYKVKDSFVFTGTKFKHVFSYEYVEDE